MQPPRQRLTLSLRNVKAAARTSSAQHATRSSSMLCSGLPRGPCDGTSRGVATPLQTIVRVDQRPGAGRPAAALAQTEHLDAVLPHQLQVRVKEPVQIDIDRVAAEPGDRQVL